MDGARTTDLPINTPLHYPLDHHGFTPTMHESLVFQPEISRVYYTTRGVTCSAGHARPDVFP